MVKEKTGHAISVIDKTKGPTFGKLVCFWKDNKTDALDLKEKMAEVNKLYSPDLFIIETNGVGQSTIQMAIIDNLPVYDWSQTKDKNYDCLLRTKIAIELGNEFMKVSENNPPISGPEELTREVESLSRDKNGKWKGDKDGLMSIGLALWDLENNPHKLENTIDRSRFYVEEFPKSRDPNWF